MLQLLNPEGISAAQPREWEEKLRAEMQRVECHKNQLAQPIVSDADDVLQPFTDHYHKVEVTIDDSKARLQDERQRSPSFVVELRNAHQMRVDAIAVCEEALETREKERRERLKKTLVEFVEALTKSATQASALPTSWRSGRFMTSTSISAKTKLVGKHCWHNCAAEKSCGNGTIAASWRMCTVCRWSS
ncbi:hypothetical protein C3747_366g32 [Trypanosoma cruzi]|uniref:Uncharacterized protein n=1 Tax=Trypanosoma cruzi TaxID=5693 RepID=A0A2V2V849_TRYCR|nr:hypothetical protein C3747_366g32 [Trypanosoma cruzi]